MEENMKETGIVRRIDELGRIVIPKEIRKNFHIDEGEPMEIYIQDGCIVIKKYAVNEDINELLLNVKESLQDKKGSEQNDVMIGKVDELLALIKKDAE
jgi:AbrB family transcriptional regulator (stage V sporulation protein T)